MIMRIPTNRIPGRPAATQAPGRLRMRRGMTLLELTVVILVLLSLITILFFGARGWKRGSDRALCIVNIQHVQKGVRGYSNLYDIEAGSTVVGLKSQVIGMGRFVESVPTCPAAGTYSFGAATGGEDTIPPVGQLYMNCDLQIVDEHIPVEFSNW
jgi:prepilin-type N-terminal cleavage/methylation domain-containing protein